MVIVYLYIRTRLLTRWLIKMIFKNSNAVFPSVFIYLFIYLFIFFEFLPYSVLFRFFSFLNNYKCFSTASNVTEVGIEP